MVEVRLARRGTDSFRVYHLVQKAITLTPQYSDQVIDKELSYLTQELVYERIDDELCLVATSDEKVVGTCFGEDEGGVIWLSWIAVNPLHQKTGIGSQLLEAFSELAKKRGHKVACSSLMTNYESHRLLTKGGFKTVALSKNHWHGLDFYLWEKLL